MPVVHLDCRCICTWDGFHAQCQIALGFPSFYGHNMDAWIDCMTSLDSPTDGMTCVHCAPPDVLTLALDAVEYLPDDIFAAIMDCSAFVNWRRMQAGAPPVLAIACGRNRPKLQSQSPSEVDVPEPRS